MAISGTKRKQNLRGQSGMSERSPAEDSENGSMVRRDQSEGYSVRKEKTLQSVTVGITPLAPKVPQNHKKQKLHRNSMPPAQQCTRQRNRKFHEVIETSVTNSHMIKVEQEAEEQQLAHGLTRYKLTWFLT
eukprot:5574278-Amphidinium_carterae.1